jgi:hypothetical protein
LALGCFCVERTVPEFANRRYAVAVARGIVADGGAVSMQDGRRGAIRRAA